MKILLLISRLFVLVIALVFIHCSRTISILQSYDGSMIVPRSNIVIHGEQKCRQSGLTVSYTTPNPALFNCGPSVDTVNSIIDTNSQNVRLQWAPIAVSGFISYDSKPLYFLLDGTGALSESNPVFAVTLGLGWFNTFEDFTLDLGLFGGIATIDNKIKIIATNNYPGFAFGTNLIIPSLQNAWRVERNSRDVVPLIGLQSSFHTAKEYGWFRYFAQIQAAYQHCFSERTITVNTISYSGSIGCYKNINDLLLISGLRIAALSNAASSSEQGVVLSASPIAGCFIQTNLLW